MRIEVRERNAEGEVVVVGFLNQKEISYLLQYGINSLMAMGMEFDLQTNPEETEQIRLRAANGIIIH